jgi:peptidylprolyl isomerase
LRFVARAKDGAIFARSAADSSPDIECVRQLTPGVSETVRQMVVDEQRRAWVPARLNATTVDSGEAPARAIDLIYEITLVGIIKAPPTPSPLKSPAAGARKLPSGVAVKWLSKGAGKVHPAPSNRVSLHQTSWTTDGALFESTVMAGQPATYVVAELLPGVRDGVEQLVVGDRARFWIPAELAYGKKPKRRGQPAGNLVYDVELLSLE